MGEASKWTNAILSLETVKSGNVSTQAFHTETGELPFEGQEAFAQMVFILTP